jgi:predicted dehydrogenase
MNKLRAAVIGVGYLGNFHAQKYAALEDVELIGVVDVNPDNASKVAGSLGVAAYTDYREVLDRVNLVSVVVPTEQHHAVTRDCLEAGVHVLVEKPITRTTAEAQELIDCAAARGRVLQVGHLERFNPAILALQGLTLEPMFIESHRMAPFRPRGTDVNVVLDLMIHDIDNILQLVPSELIDIRAVGVPVLSDEVDIANARLEFSNGCAANVTASRVSREFMRKIRLFQHDAYISIDYRAHKVSVQRRVPSAADPDSVDIEIEERAFAESDALLCEIRAFVDAVRNGTPPVVSGQDGKRALEVALEITRLMGIKPE